MSELPSVKPYVILAQFRVAAADRAAFAEPMRHHAAHVRASGGARQFEFHAAWDEDDRFLLYEEFATEADWQAHQSTPDTQAVLATVRPLLAGTGVGGQRSIWQLLDGYDVSDTPPGHTTVVRSRIKPGGLASLREEVRADVAAAAGLCRFDMNLSPTEPSQLLICARWRSREAWQAHQSQPGYVAFRERTAPLFDGIPDRTLWQPLR